MNRRLIGVIKGNDDDNYDVEIKNLNASWWNWLVWRFFDKSVLPFSGGFMEQPAWIIDDMMTIDAEYYRLKEQFDGDK